MSKEDPIECCCGDQVIETSLDEDSILIDAAREESTPMNRMINKAIADP